MDFGRHDPCSYDGVMHYSMNFAQHVHYPSNPLQPGPVYFKTPRTCAIFGVACEALPKQVTFLIDESVQSGKGANCVLSLLHSYFEKYGMGETHMHLHTDNCAGQNKHSYVIWYLLWCVLTGQHVSIAMSFLPTGHTKSSYQGLLKGDAPELCPVTMPLEIKPKGLDMKRQWYLYYSICMSRQRSRT